MGLLIKSPYVLSLAVGEPEIAVRLNFLALFAVLPVTVLLIYYWGLTGAGLSWVVYHLFAYWYGVPQLCHKCIKISVGEWYSHIVKIFVLISISYGMAWIFNGLIGNFSTTSLATSYFIGSLFFSLVPIL